MFIDLTNTSWPRKSQPFSVNLDIFPVDKKAIYVDSVCAALIESRFGPGRSWMLKYDFKIEPLRHRAVIYDLTCDGPVPSYSILPDSEMASRYTHEIISAELREAKIKPTATRINRILSLIPTGGSP